jgi:hypothetical protein
MVVHVQTTLQTIFGVLDDQGNVVQKVPVNLEIQKLDPALFHEACNHLLASKVKLEEQVAGAEGTDEEVVGEEAPKATKSRRSVKK